MAEFSESDGFQGYKTRISELCEIESTQPSLKEHHAKSFSPKQQPSAIVSSVKAETESENGHLSKSKCCSSDESEPKVDVVQEKQETEEDKLGFSEGGVVCEKGQELKDCEVGLSENQEIGEASSSSGLLAKEIQKHVVVEDPKKVWDAVYVSFDENEYEYCLRNKEEGCLVEPAVESVVDAVKIKEEFHNLSCAVDGNLETVEIPDTDRKGSVCEGMHNVAGSDGEKVDGLEENGENKKCSLKIEVIDETAVIETIPGDEFGNGIGKEKGFMSCGKHSEMNVHKNLIKQEGKKEKRPRRKGKGAKQLWGTNGKENIPTHMVEKRSDEAKRAYSRQEMEALRFVNLEAQRKKWLEVYCGLAPTVTKEYEGLIDFDNQKHIRLNFDPRHQFGKKEKKTPGILGMVAAKGRGNHLKIFVH
ncbi:hypothetical protein U1Q18_030478 [Sarracenia purpurea var. burkii]